MSFLIVLALCSTVGFGQTAGPVEDILDEGGNHRYTGRYRSFLLEDAVQARPECPKLWEALIHALDVEGHDPFAERASRTALKHCPGHPQLLIARANVLAPSASFGVLEELGKVPGYKEEAGLRLQLARLGLNGPWGRVESVKPNVVWIEKLITAGLYQTSLAALERGLQHSPDDSHLLARKAITLCLMDRYQDAMAAHRAAKGVQSFRPLSEMPYYGLTDCLVLKEQWSLAIESLADTPPEGLRQQLDLGLALLCDGQHKEAEDVLAQTGAIGQLLLYGHAARNDQPERMTAIEESLRQEIDRQSSVFSKTPTPWYSVSRMFVPGHPVSSVLERAFSELAARQSEVRLRMPMSFGARRWAGSRSFADETVKSSTGRVRKIRRQLAQELTKVQDYAGAAKALAPLAVQPASDWNRQRGRINMDAVRWCIAKRRADAEKLHQQAPQSLASARFPLESLNALRWNYAHLPDKPWLVHPEAVERLCRIGPGVLSSVFEEFGPNTISGQDRSAYVHVIERIGSEQDVPVLLNVLALVVREDTESKPNRGANEGKQRNSEQRKATEKAIHHCLEKLTGAANKADSRKERVLFWLSWWEANAARLVLSTGRGSDHQKSVQPSGERESPS